MTGPYAGVRTAGVVGGGISGLTAAAALARAGWDVTVFDQSPVTGIGAGITLWPNALRALDSIGAGDAVRAVAGPQVSGGIRTWDGTWLVRSGSGATSPDLVVLRRADLVEVLGDFARQCGADIRTGVRVESADDQAGLSIGGERRAYGLLVGADGIRSLVRRAVFPEAPQPRYSGFTTWRWVVSGNAPADGAEVWGPGAVFGYVPLRDAETYVFAGLVSGPHDRAAGLDHFARWAEPVPRLARCADALPDVLRHDVWELPPLTAYARARVALVGDAAHAMTPNLGQGGCQGIEDAVTLAGVVDCEDVVRSLVAYDEQRRPRATRVQRRSRQMARMAMMSSPALVRWRNLALRSLPQRVSDRAMDAVVGWTPAP